jgi:hypothetical protein
VWSACLPRCTCPFFCFVSCKELFYRAGTFFRLALREESKPYVALMVGSKLIYELIQPTLALHMDASLSNIPVTQPYGRRLAAEAMKADAEPLSAPPRYQPPNPNSLARPRSTNDVIKRLNDNIMSKQQGGAAGEPQPPSASSELAALLKADSGVCWALSL